MVALVKHPEDFVQIPWPGNHEEHFSVFTRIVRGVTGVMAGVTAKCFQIEICEWAVTTR
jgi:hypothetical protein